jgi:hypothetical protein
MGLGTSRRRTGPHYGVQEDVVNLGLLRSREQGGIGIEFGQWGQAKPSQGSAQFVTPQTHWDLLLGKKSQEGDGGRTDNHDGIVRGQHGRVPGPLDRWRQLVMVKSYWQRPYGNKLGVIWSPFARSQVCRQRGGEGFLSPRRVRQRMADAKGRPCPVPDTLGWRLGQEHPRQAIP